MYWNWITEIEKVRLS